MGFFTEATEASEAAIENYRIDLLYPGTTWGNPYASFSEFGTHLKFACAQTPTFFLCMIGSALNGIINLLQTIYFLVLIDKISAQRYFEESLRNFGMAIMLLVLTIASTPLALYICILHIFITLLYPVLKKFKPDLQTRRERLAEYRKQITHSERLTFYLEMLTLKEDSSHPMIVEWLKFDIQKNCALDQFAQDRLAHGNELARMTKKLSMLSKTLDESRSKQSSSDDEPSVDSERHKSKQLLNSVEKLNSDTPRESCFDLCMRMRKLLEDIVLPPNYDNLPLDLQIAWLEKIIDQYAHQYTLYMEATVLYLEESGLEMASSNRVLDDLSMQVEDLEKQLSENGIIAKFEEDISARSYSPGLFTPEKIELFSKPRAALSRNNLGL